jgi:hypothetical protein
VVYSTLSIDGVLEEGRRLAIDATATRQGGRAIWRSSPRAERTYALLELPDRYDRAALRVASGVVYDKPIIAVALFPAMAEALPPLLEALGGAGSPAGVLSCKPCPNGVVVEWDPDVTQAPVIMELADVELRRFASGRVAELLSPLPPELVARVAASGLRAPQIEPQRVLELRINGA